MLRKRDRLSEGILTGASAAHKDKDMVGNCNWATEK